jgi:hypothetical protein
MAACAGKTIASANNKIGVFQIAFICIFLSWYLLNWVVTAVEVGGPHWRVMLQSIRDLFSLVGRTKMSAETALSHTLTWKAIFFAETITPRKRNPEGGPQAEPAEQTGTHCSRRTDQQSVPASFQGE